MTSPVRPNRRASRCLFLGQRRVRGDRLDAVVIDADRHRHDGARAAVEPDARRFDLDLGPELLLRRQQEVAAIALELEREQVVGQQAGEDLAPPRTDAQPIGIRPRNVPEQRRPGVGAARPQRRRDQREVIVLDEDRRLGRRELLVDRRGEPDVDLLVRRPVLGAELRPDVHHVAERPQPFVGEPAVVRGERRLLEPQPPQRVGRSVGRHHHLVVRVDDLAIGVAGAVRDPDAAALAHQRIERHGHAAGRRLAVIAAVAVPGVQIRLAVRHDEQRPRGRGLEIARPREALAEEDRADELVNGDQRDEQRLQLRAPAGKFGGDDRGESERDAGLGDQPGPGVLPGGGIDAGARKPKRQPEPDGRDPDRGDGKRQQADGRERVQPQRRADGDEEDHQDRRRAALHGGLERVALRDREVLDDQARGHRGQQRLELLRGADLAEQPAHHDQHQRDLAADVPQIQREQRADQRAERDGAADLPREPRDHADVADAGAERRPRQLHREREQHQQGEVGQDHHGEHELAQPAARAGLRRHRRGHRRREADDDERDQRRHRERCSAGGVGRRAQPRPGDPGDREQPAHRDRQRRRGHARDRREARPKPLEVQRQAGDQRDQRRGDAGDDLELARHRLGDDVAEIGAGQHAEQQVAGEPRQVEAAEDVAGDPSAEQREAKRQRGAGGSDVDRRAQHAYPHDGQDGQRERRHAFHSTVSRGRGIGCRNSDPTTPMTTMLMMVVASDAVALTAFSANARPTTPGASSAIGVCRRP